MRAERKTNLEKTFRNKEGYAMPLKQTRVNQQQATTTTTTKYARPSTV